MRKPALAMLALLPLGTGCTMSHVQFVDAPFEPATAPDAATAAGTQVLGHLYANSWGYYVFAKLPYLSGGVDEDGRPEWRYFEDAVKVETVVTLLEAEARRRGATHLVDLKSDWLSEWAAPSLIFWIVETQASATALRVSGEAPAGAIPLGPGPG